MIKYINFLILCFLLLILYTFNLHNNISYQILDILPQGENKELVKEFEKLNSHKYLYLFYRSSDTNSFKELQKIEKELLSIQGIQTPKINKKFTEYQEKYFYILNNLQQINMSDKEIQNRLNKIHQNLIESPFSYKINTTDPLGLYPVKNSYSKYIKLENKGYITLLSLEKNINTTNEYTKIYKQIKALEKLYPKLETFSVIYYYVENAQLIRNDVNKIIVFATIVLLLLYILLLRDLKLLINTSTVIVTSLLSAFILVNLLFDTISIFALVFAISMSTVAIDYMFHNYTHGYYLKKKSFNKDVFFGMITTVGSLFLISFVEFTLLKQICYFAIFSLITSYLLFTFLFPYLKIKQPKHLFSFKPFVFNLNHFVIFIVSIILLFTAISSIKLDTNIKNLDVENTNLTKLHQFFNTHMKQEDTTAVLVTGKTIKELVDNGYHLKTNYQNSKSPIYSIPSHKAYYKKQEQWEKNNFNNLNKKVIEISTNLGFRESTFKKSYQIENIILPTYNYELLQSFSIKKFNDYYISYAIVSNKNYADVLKESYVKPLTLKDLFTKDLEAAVTSLSKLGFITLCFILIMIYVAVKEKFFNAVNFILLPVAITLCLSFYYEINILHIFMMIVLISIGIDYGIYMNSKEFDNNTHRAIIYSLLSTFAGFGVLIFSNINALYTIGITASLGIVSIIILLSLQKGYK